LIRKLGIREGMRVAFVGAPDHYERLLGKLPAVQILGRPGKQMDFVHVFATAARELERRLPGWKAALADDGMLWISWPKKTSSLETDLSGDVVRAAGLASGLVDVKVCAVDDDWSGLKFVYRVKDRGGVGPRRARASDG
jgi:hypothetical protein